jgi:hypothetical protein
MVTRWNFLAGIATALCTCIAGFLKLPPLDYGNSDWSKFGVFIVTLLVGFWLIPVQLFSKRKALRGWLASAAISTAAAAALYFAYSLRMNEWTFPYSGRLVVIGTNLSPRAAADQSEWTRMGRSVTNDELLWHYGGNSADVWPDLKERDHRTYLLHDPGAVPLLLAGTSVLVPGFCG